MEIWIHTEMQSQRPTQKPCTATFGEVRRLRFFHLIEESYLLAMSLNFALVIGVSDSEEDQVDQEKVAAVFQLVVTPCSCRYVSSPTCRRIARVNTGVSTNRIDTYYSPLAYRSSIRI